MLAGPSLETEASAPTQLSVNSSDHSGRSRNGLLRAVALSSFLFWFLVSVESCKKSPMRSLLLRVVAGHGVESSVVKSCGTDVQNVLEGPVDNPEQRQALHSPCCIVCSCRFQMWCLTTGPLIGISVVFADFSKQ